jgi:hypothetical protein
MSAAGQLIPNKQTLVGGASCARTLASCLDVVRHVDVSFAHSHARWSPSVFPDARQGVHLRLA